MPSAKRRIASHGMRTQTPASRKSSPSCRKPSSDPWDTMIRPNRHPPVWRITQGAWSLHHSRRTAHSICQQIPHGHRDPLCQHQERTLSDCIWLWKIPYISVRKDNCHGNWPQAPGDDQPEKSHSSPCTTSENAPPSAAIWPDHNVQTRQGNASGRCPQPPPIQNKHWDQVRPMSWCHINLCILPETSHQDCSWDAMRPHPLDGAPTHPEQLAWQTRSCPPSGQILLELLRWALHWRRPPHQGWTSGHSTILQRQYNGGPPWKPCWHQ